MTRRPHWTQGAVGVIWVVSHAVMIVFLGGVLAGWWG